MAIAEVQTNASNLGYTRQSSSPLGLLWRDRQAMFPTSSTACPSRIKSCSVEHAEASLEHSGTAVFALGRRGCPVSWSEHLCVLSVFQAVHNSKLLLPSLWFYQAGLVQSGCGSSAEWELAAHLVSKYNEKYTLQESSVPFPRIYPNTTPSLLT